jgi:hypothetical protein
MNVQDFASLISAIAALLSAIAALKLSRAGGKHGKSLD